MTLMVIKELAKIESLAHSHQAGTSIFLIEIVLSSASENLLNLLQKLSQVPFRYLLQQPAESIN